MTTAPSRIKGNAASPAKSDPAPLNRRVVSHVRYETLTMLRNGEQLLLLVILPVIALIGLTRSEILDASLPPGVSRIDYAVAGVLALSVISNAFSGQGIQTGFDRRYGVLRQLATTPLGRGGLLAGKLGAVLVVLALQYGVIGLAAYAMGWRPSITALFASVLFLIPGAVAFIGLGLLVAGTLRAEATLAFVNLMWVLLAAIGGTLAPATALPDWATPVVSVLPSSVLAEGLRHVMAQDSLTVLTGPVIGLTLWAACAWTAALRWFRWN